MRGWAATRLRVGGTVIAVEASAPAVAAAVADTIDVLVLNIPMTRDNTRFLAIADAQLQAALDMMVFDVVAIVQAALPRMGAGGRTVVVSARGHLGAWGGAHLMAANAVLMGLMGSIAPDFIGERWDTAAARAEVAEATAFLARDGLTLLSGQTLLLDGMRGLRMTESRRQ